jgi:hypothetical protein
MSENVPGYLTQLAMGAATGLSLPAFTLDVYSSIIDIDEITPPSASRQVEEYYVLDQKDAKKIVGSITWSPCQGTLTRAFDSAIHDQFENDVAAAVAVRRNWRFQLPNAGAQTNYFVGYASKFEFQGINNQSRIQIAYEVVVDGGVTIVR